MKLIIAAALAATALTAVAAPAMAQGYGPPPPGPGYGPPAPQQYGPPPQPGQFGPPPAGAFSIDQRIDWMQDRINHGRMDGSLDHFEADRVQAELNSIRSEEKRDRFYHWGKLRGGDRTHIQMRLDRLGATIHWMHDAPRRPW